MLGGGKHRGVVCSTVAELEGVLPLVKEGVLDEVRQYPELCSKRLSWMLD